MLNPDAGCYFALSALNCYCVVVAVVIIVVAQLLEPAAQPIKEE